MRETGIGNSRFQRYAACPDHVPFPVGLHIAKISGQAFLSEKTSAIFLMEDVGESLRSRRASLDVILGPGEDCDAEGVAMVQSFLKQWLCEIVAVTEEAHRNQLLWHDDGFHACSICWNDRTERWYLTESDITRWGDEMLTFETSWGNATRNFKSETSRCGRALAIFVEFMDQNLLHPCESITANGLRRKFGMVAT